MVKKLVVTTCTEAVVLAVAAMINPTFLHQNAIWIALGAMAIIVIVAIYEWWSAKAGAAPAATGSTVQSSSGANSPPIIGQTVNVHYGPPASEPTPAGKPYGYDIGKLNDGLERAFAALAGGRELSDIASGGCPTMRASKAIEWVAGVLHDTDASVGFLETRRQIRQAAIEHRITIWGRQQIRPTTHDSPIAARDFWVPIEADYWLENKINAHASEESADDRQHTAEEPLRGHHNGYWSLRLDEAEIHRVWPKIQRVFMSTIPDPQPQPDLPLNGLLVRVYAKLGGEPSGASARAAFKRRVNLEIMDRIAHNHLSVWGRFGVRALEAISDNLWQRGTLDHEKNAFSVSISYGDPATYDDLHFNKAEIDKVWPKP